MIAYTAIIDQLLCGFTIKSQDNPCEISDVKEWATPFTVQMYPLVKGTASDSNPFVTIEKRLRKNRLQYSPKTLPKCIWVTGFPPNTDRNAAQILCAMLSHFINVECSDSEVKLFYGWVDLNHFKMQCQGAKR